jgi:hypothetical protein
MALKGRHRRRKALRDMVLRTTTQRGLGYPHQQSRRYLIANLIDGTLCWWCGLAMHKAADSNWDHAELEADHSHSRAHGGHRADRLLHRFCNRQRGDGKRDHLRPTVTGVSVRESRNDQLPVDRRLMSWPC